MKFINVVKYQKLALFILAIPALCYFSIFHTIQYIKPPLNSESDIDITSGKIINYMFYLGMALGSIVIIPLIDRYGHKCILYCVCIGGIIVAFYHFIADDNFDYCIIMILYGGFTSVYYGIYAIYTIEIFPSEPASIYFVIIHISLVISSGFSIFLLQFFESWIYIIWISSSFLVIYLILSMLLVDSPTFLITRGP